MGEMGREVQIIPITKPHKRYVKEGPRRGVEGLRDRAMQH